VFDQARYVFALLWLVAFPILFLWAALPVLVFLLHTVVLLEERELEERFGDAWREYAARVPRYLPRLGA